MSYDIEYILYIPIIHIVIIINENVGIRICVIFIFHTIPSGGFYKCEFNRIMWGVSMNYFSFNLNLKYFIFNEYTRKLYRTLAKQLFIAL